MLIEPIRGENLEAVVSLWQQVDLTPSLERSGHGLPASHRQPELSNSASTSTASIAAVTTDGAVVSIDDGSVYSVDGRAP